MELGLGDKVALVAAASRGLGRATADALAAEGASLVICARGSEALDEARREISGKRHVEVEAVVADVATEFSSFDTTIDSIRSTLLTLPPETTVRTGHGDSTSIGVEAPHLEEWIARGH